MKNISEEKKRCRNVFRFFKGWVLSFSLIVMSLLFINEGRGNAQSLTESDANFLNDRVKIGLKIQNMHLWHGSVVTPGGMMASSIEYVSLNKKFVAGLWGGASFNGEYKEFSYYTSYHISNNFKVSLIDHNNYSNSGTPEIFSYDKYTSPNFVDVVLEYFVSEKVPVTFYWSTILFGNGGDYATEMDGTVTDSYSNYAELRYTLFPKEKSNIAFFVGGAFSFFTEKTFYSEQANFVNFGLTANSEINLFSKKIPVTATAFWNPETEIGALQLAISVF